MFDVKYLYKYFSVNDNNLPTMHRTRSESPIVRVRHHSGPSIIKEVPEYNNHHHQPSYPQPPHHAFVRPSLAQHSSEPRMSYQNAHHQSDSKLHNPNSDPGFHSDSFHHDLPSHTNSAHYFNPNTDSGIAHSTTPHFYNPSCSASESKLHCSDSSRLHGLSVDTTRSTLSASPTRSCSSNPAMFYSEASNASPSETFM